MEHNVRKIIVEYPDIDAYMESLGGGEKVSEALEEFRDEIDKRLTRIEQQVQKGLDDIGGKLFKDFKDIDDVDPTLKSDPKLLAAATKAYNRLVEGGREDLARRTTYNSVGDYVVKDHLSEAALKRLTQALKRMYIIALE